MQRFGDPTSKKEKVRRIRPESSPIPAPLNTDPAPADRREEAMALRRTGRRAGIWWALDRARRRRRGSTRRPVDGLASPPRGGGWWPRRAAAWGAAEQGSRAAA